MIAGAIVLVVLALIALLFTVVLVLSAWAAVRDELLSGFRTRSPGPATLALAMLGFVGPASLTALFTGYLALRLIGLLRE